MLNVECRMLNDGASETQKFNSTLNILQFDIQHSAPSRTTLEATVNRAVRQLFIPGLLLAFAVSLSAQDLASFEKRTTVRKLDNGLTVIVLDRPEAPVFSFTTVVYTGAAQENAGTNR